MMVSKQFKTTLLIGLTMPMSLFILGGYYDGTEPAEVKQLITDIKKLIK